MYNGKEKIEGVGLYDYGARMYDPVIARWTSVDPLAEAYNSFSSYNYVLGNPVNLIDPDGMRVSLFEKMANQVGSTDESRQKSTGEYGIGGSSEEGDSENSADAEECCPDGGSQWRAEHRNVSYLKGKITEEQFWSQYKAEASGAMEGISWILTGGALKLVFKGGKWLWRGKNALGVATTVATKSRYISAVGLDQIPKELVVSLISKGKIRYALREAIIHNTNSNTGKILLELQSRWSRIRLEKMRDVVSHGNRLKAENKVIKALIETIH